MGSWFRFITISLLAILSLASLTAEVWSNDKPIILKYENHIYLPAFFRYHPRQFHIIDRMVVDYKSLPLAHTDWAIWPINRWNPFQSNHDVAEYPSRPSRANWLGTDDRGRDVFSRLLYGFRYSLAFSFLVWAISTAIAMAFGATLGFAGGWVDLIGQRAIEIFASVPQLFILMYLMSLFEPSLSTLGIVSGILGWMALCAYIRAEVLRVRKARFVEAARALGASPWRIVIRHILPNCLGPVIAFSPFIIAGNMTALAALEFLGFGLPPPTPSLGELLQQGQTYFHSSWWLATFPSVILFLTLIGITLVGTSVQNRLGALSNRR